MLSTAVATDFRSYLLDDVSGSGGDAVPLGEVIRTFMFGAPVVRDAYDHFPGNYKETKAQLAVFNGIFNQGPYLWPVPLTANVLDCLFRPNVHRDREMIGKWGTLPTELTQAFEHIGCGFAAMIDAFRSKVTVVDLDGNQVPAFLWRRPGLKIDLTKSDLYDTNSENPVVLRRGLHLLRPAAAAAVVGVSPMVDVAVSSEADPPAGNPSLAPSPKQTAEPALAAGGKCKKWLTDLMRQSPQLRPKTKKQIFEDAQGHFGKISFKSFERVWGEAIGLVPGCNWNAQGRPKGTTQSANARNMSQRQLAQPPSQKPRTGKPRAK